MAMDVRCGILGGGRSSWALLLLAMGGGGWVTVCRSVHLASVGEYQRDQKIVWKGGNSKRVLISIRHTLSCTYVWLVHIYQTRHHSPEYLMTSVTQPCITNIHIY